MSKVTVDMIIAELERCNGNKTQAARNLGINRSTLRVRLGQARVDGVELPADAEHRLIKENRQLKARLKDVLEINEKAQDLDAIVSKITQTPSQPPNWIYTKPKKKIESAIITAALSDTHFDEVVDPAQINYVNAYNREIATIRLKNFFTNLIRLSSEYINGIKIDGLCMPMLGDMVSGVIHEELKETNEAAIIDTCLYYSDLIIAGVEMLLDTFDKIYIPCVVGNHGRMDKKPKAKGRAQDSFDYLIYHIVARHFADVDEVTFGISAGSDFRYSLYDTRYQLTHGDQFRGGTGIAGMFSPIMLGDARKRKREVAAGSPYDYLVMGHWHKLAHIEGIIINGTTKGYDEWTSQMNFSFEPPQQAFWLTDPKHGKTINAPIHVAGENEGWEQRPLSTSQLPAF